MSNVETAAEMPRYRCHKEVWALKIKAIALAVGTGKEPGALVTPEDSRYGAFPVTREYLSKHKPQAGGYYVVYKDGYASFSPADAFEEGYTKI